MRHVRLLGWRHDRRPPPASTAAPDDTLYGITELAREHGISLRAIRFYEDKGLLAPRRINGGRAYTRRDRVRLGLILRGKAVGMSLAEIEHILSLYGEHGEGHARQLDYLIVAHRCDDRGVERAQVPPRRHDFRTGRGTRAVQAHAGGGTPRRQGLIRPWPVRRAAPRSPCRSGWGRNPSPRRTRPSRRRRCLRRPAPLHRCWPGRRRRRSPG
jgi:DNA-binding transcriptional MerR regulator